MGETAEQPSRKERYRRLVDEAGHLFMVPMDHGISMGPIPGIAPIAETLAKVADLATCTTVHKGLVSEAREFQGRLGLIMHLSASTDEAPDPNDKRIIGTVEEALALGADAVSVHINVGSATEADQIEAVGHISTQCNLLGVPLIAMVYPRGPNVKNPLDPILVAHAARLGRELGADAVKVPYTGTADSFRHVVAGAGIPVIVAGGPKADDDEQFIQFMQGAAEAGAAGISVGRNVFQHADPATILRRVIGCFQ